jgi:ATP-dependent DNA ligase
VRSTGAKAQAVIQLPDKMCTRLRTALGATELVVEFKYLHWTDDNLLRQVIYQGLREDKPPTEVHRPAPHA